MTDFQVKTFQLRAELAEILERVQKHNTRATIMRHGVPVAYVVSVETVTELDRLQRLHRTTVTADYTRTPVKYVHKSVKP